MITGFAITIVLIAGIFAIRQLGGALGQLGHNEAATALKEVEKAFLAKGEELLMRGKSKLEKKVPAELVDRLVQEGADYFFSRLDRTPTETAFSLDSEGYAFVITEDVEHPFQLTPLIAETAKKITGGKNLPEEKARAIFEWFERDITYGRTKLKSGVGYRHASEVFADREGVCGEMAILYIVMARSCGIPANYTSVKKDFQGQDVHHACVAATLKGRQALIDPAYHAFDIKHKKFEVLDDRNAVPHFKSFRGYKGG